MARPPRTRTVGPRLAPSPLACRGAQGLVSALLDDPLASNPDLAVQLESRRLGPAPPEALTIRHGDAAQPSPSEVQVPSKWLRETNAQVVEIVHGDVPPLESSFSALHLADIVVLVLSDSTLLSSKAAQTLLYNLHTKPNLLLALNCPDASPSASTSPLRTLQHQLDTLFPSPEGGQPAALAISTEQALAALEALSPSEPDQPPSYDAFQKGYIASRIPHLHQLLTTALIADSPASSTTGPTPLQLQTAHYVLSAALSRAAFAGAQVADSLTTASSALSALAQHAAEQKAALLASLGVEGSTGLVRVPADEQRASLAALDELFASRLEWYKLPYRVDDLHAEVALVVGGTFLPSFEKQLVFATARAHNAAQALSSRVDAVFASPTFSAAPRSTPLSPAAQLASLYSATLLNSLAQAGTASLSALSASPTSSTALSSAVSRRRAQITAPGGPTDLLQRRAQRAVVRSATFAASSVALAGAGEALGWVAQTGTSVGLGLLGVTLGAWGLQRAWGKAVRRFRKDVGERVVGGLEEDLGVRARRIAERAGYKAEVAVRLGEDKVRERRVEWEAFRATLRCIEERRRALVDETEVDAVAQPKKRIGA
ncbi:hypothetical protein Rhopal_004090-T1 [Rhodotorula paludigena]|uniref:Mmc1 C-terminal domain-containing protein n=1 Tax=Rhodotorula paludigena TaxID=86838 RepID=A0AAV5GMG2_9BASI|nr:hypothetical protein Rhopal_004090-T1 [Rhodotorula paludigena]